MDEVKLECNVEAIQEEQGFVTVAHEELDEDDQFDDEPEEFTGTVPF